MMRVVLDTNVIVSAYLNEDGQPFRVLKLALAGLVRLCASEPILAEYQELLERKSFPLDARRAALLLKKIRNASTIVKPASRLKQALTRTITSSRNAPRQPRRTIWSPATPCISRAGGSTPSASRQPSSW